MRRWQDELRRLLDERGDALLVAARDAVDQAGDELDPVTVLEDALVAVYSTRRPARSAGSPLETHRPGSLALVLDDELDEPTAVVEAAIERAAGRKRREGAPSDEPRRAVDVATVEAHARTARRHHAVVGWSTAGGAAAVVVGLVVTAFTGPSGQPAAPPEASPVAAAFCGSTEDLGAGADAATDAPRLQVTLTSQTHTLAPKESWVGTVTTPSTVDGRAAIDLGALSPVPLLVLAGRVVATAATPGTTLVFGPSFARTRFVPCPGSALQPGAYDVIVDQPVQVGRTRYRVVSNRVPVWIITTEPDGYRPSWLSTSPIACGMTLDELAARAAGATPANLVASSLRVDEAGLTWEFLNPGIDTVTYAGNRELGLLWVQDGVVRSVGHDLAASDGSVRVRGQTTLKLSATWDTTDYCSPDDHATKPSRRYPGHLPAGLYQVYAYARVSPPTGTVATEAWFVQTAAPAHVRVGADGRIDGR